MSVLQVLHIPDERLRKVAKPVEEVNAEIQRIVDDMFETMYAEEGIGLAATQVDIHQRIIVIDVSENRDEQLVLINPELLEKDGETFGTIVYDKDGSVNKITIAEYEISKVTDKEGTFRNEYAVYVKPSATTRKYRLIISVYCTTPEHEMKASPARITIE